MDELLLHFLELHYFIEMLKLRGFPTSEASRSQQYIYQLQTEFEKLKGLKHFGTPQSAEAFLRIFVLVIPIIFAPYFTWVALPENVGIAFAMILSMLTAYILICLIDLQRTLEDPFISVSIDGKKLTDEFDQMIKRIMYVRSKNNHRRKKLLLGKVNFSFTSKDITANFDLESSESDLMEQAQKLQKEEADGS
uniref:Uncharacterized protein n=2 Tax=Aplanochytrium stocchinoi TaxID=215587 RepID=A0A7S3LKY2_9STRA|mmetsp:Transcript_20369/g.26013  ORF Transcript_20369/g.26013 Transcript_20369/m.26013 type:complete len:193 (-) Transcript_20369:840-1418(-)